jgi:predicted AAA+ superfamily ATPase
LQKLKGVDMQYIKREIEDSILKDLNLNKVIIIFGPRRVGKTILLKQIISSISEDYILLNGEDMEHQEILKNRSTANYSRLLGDKKLLVIDEAQAIKDIGLKLKLMIDTIPDLRIIATGSLAFDLNNKMGEPLVGRKIDFNLFPLSQMELSHEEDYLTIKSKLEERLIFGGYPELEQIANREDKIAYLKDLENSYLLKDIIAFEGIKKRDKIVQLLKIIAFRVGSEISMEGIGNSLQISKNTVDKYLDLLSKVFIIHRVSGFSRNLDNEITKKSKWYFYDNGIRNAIISNFNSIENRDDIGKLWENYFISERIKYLNYSKTISNNFFWRNRNKQELDWLEEIDDQLNGYELKWNVKDHPKPSPSWRKAYPEAKFIVINPNNYLDYII